MVDLERAAQQIKVDLLAVNVSQTLAAAAVPHALLKGPTTAWWLYDEPRSYADVDILVPMSRIEAAVRALADGGVAHASAGRLGEEAGHSLLMVTPDGVEVDLHVTLPSLAAPRRPDDDLVWRTLEPHVVPWDMDGARVPALDQAARCLVLALHAVASGSASERVREDLRRARRVASADDWATAGRLAEALRADAFLRAGLSLIEPGQPAGPLSAEAVLRTGGASGLAIQLQRLRALPPPAMLAALWNKAMPSPGFMRAADPTLGSSRAALGRAYARRALRVLRALPGAVREVAGVRPLDHRS